MTTYKMGPGTLTLGAGPLQVAGQITNCRVESSENVSTGDDLNFLDGTTELGDEDATYRFTLAGTLAQDISAAGVVDWSWTNKGTEQPFTFVPSTAVGRQVQGTLTPVPLTIGGEVKSKPTSDFTWRIKGTPDFEAAP